MSSSLCAQREAGLVATCSSIRTDPRVRPGRTGTEAEALRPACPIPQGREKRATENASIFRALRTRPKLGIGRPSNTKVGRRFHSLCGFVADRGSWLG